MSPPELAESLIRSLESSAGLLRRLEHGLRARRLAWVAAHPGDLEAPLDELRHIADRLGAEDERRAGLLSELAAGLPMPQPLPGTGLQLDVRSLAPHLPAALARRLRGAADAAAALSRSVRIETALGRRLLEFSRTVHEGLVRDRAEPVCGPAAYDRNARRVRGIMPGNGRVGALIDGRL